MLALVLFLVGARALEYRDCGSGSAELVSLDIEPLPILVNDSFTVTGAAALGETVIDGELEVVVRFLGYEVYSDSQSICGDTCIVPTGTTMHFDYVVEYGSMSHTIPSGDYEVQLKGVNGDGTGMFCAKFDIVVSGDLHDQSSFLTACILSGVAALATLALLGLGYVLRLDITEKQGNLEFLWAFVAYIQTLPILGMIGGSVPVIYRDFMVGFAWSVGIVHSDTSIFSPVEDNKVVDLCPEDGVKHFIERLDIDNGNLFITVFTIFVLLNCAAFFVAVFGYCVGRYTGKPWVNGMRGVNLRILLLSAGILPLISVYQLYLNDDTESNLLALIGLGICGGTVCLGLISVTWAFDPDSELGTTGFGCFTDELRDPARMFYLVQLGRLIAIAVIIGRFACLPKTQSYALAWTVGGEFALIFLLRPYRTAFQQNWRGFLSFMRVIQVAAVVAITRTENMTHANWFGFASLLIVVIVFAFYIGIVLWTAVTRYKDYTELSSKGSENRHSIYLPC